MPRLRLSRSALDKIDYRGKQEVYFDTKLPGFGVRINQGSKVYIVHCRVRGRKGVYAKETIGRADIIDYEKALARAKEIIEDAANGISPEDRQQEKENAALNLAEERRLEESRDVTLADIFAEYMLTKKKLKASTRLEYERLIEDYCPEWKDLSLRSIDAQMIIAKHAETGERSRARADGLMRVIRAMFNFAMEAHEDLILRNPVKKLSSMDAWYRVGRREGFIPPDQLKPWFAAVLNLTFPISRDFILAQLFTGCRRNEVSSLKWKDLNLERRTVVIRETKNGKPLTIPICTYLNDIFITRKESGPHRPDGYVFATDAEGGKIRDVRSSYLKLEAVTGLHVSNHDLRRSFQSYCNTLKVPVYTIKRLSNHALPQDVTEGYIQFDMEDLRYEVERVADYILTKAGLKAGGKLISMQGRGKKKAA